MHTKTFTLFCLLVFEIPIHAQSHLPARETQALTVRHIPNPAEPIYSPKLSAYQWSYRTEVKNNLHVPLRITHFEIYLHENEKWVARNLKGRRLTSADFAEWYNDGDSVFDGWIKPGEVAVDAENWTSWGLYAPPRCKWTYTAQDAHGREYDVEAEVELVPAPAKFHSGDDAVWAQLEFDDSDWEQITNGSSPWDRWEGIGWFRFVLEIDSTFWGIPLGLVVGNIFGGAEVYLDGKLVHRFGKVVSSRGEEEAYVEWEPRAIALHPSQNRSGGRSRHMLAIRYSSFFWDSPRWSGIRWNLHWRIGFLEKMQADRSSEIRKATFHQMLLTGIFLSFTLLHLLLFLFYPSAGGKTNLYFALFTASLGAMVYFEFQSLFTDDGKLYFLLKVLHSTSGAVALLVGVRFTYFLTYSRLPKLFFLLCFVGISLTLWLWFRPFAAQKYLVIFGVVCCGLMPALVVSRLRKQAEHLEGSWIILLGMIPITLVGGYYFLATDALRLVEVPWNFEDFPAPYYAGLILVISMSVFLARNFAQTNKNLEAQLIQVKELSEKTIRQERERVQLEVENARKTRELEEARQLQLSMLPKTVPTVLNLDIAVYSKAATEVGGDYYDFHLDGDGTLTTAIGDATGHGMKAGTMVSITKGLFKSLASEASLPEILHKMSSALASMNLGSLYMAMTFVVTP